MRAFQRSRRKTRKARARRKRRQKGIKKERRSASLRTLHLTPRMTTVTTRTVTLPTAVPLQTQTIHRPAGPALRRVPGKRRGDQRRAKRTKRTKSRKRTRNPRKGTSMTSLLECQHQHCSNKCSSLSWRCKLNSSSSSSNKLSLRRNFDVSETIYNKSTRSKSETPSRNSTI